MIIITIFFIGLGIFIFLGGFDLIGQIMDRASEKLDKDKADDQDES